MYSVPALIASHLSILVYLAFATEGVAQDSESEVIERFSNFGFQLSRPATGWSVQKSTPQPGSVMLRLYPKGSAGKTAITVLAEATPATDENAAVKRDKAFSNLIGKKEFANPQQKIFRVGNKETPGLELDWTVQGDTFHVQQSYLQHEDFDFTVALYAPVEEFGDAVEALSAIRRSIEFTAISDEAKWESKLNRLIAKCGSELDWANSWQQASEQATAEGKSILVVLRSQPGFDLTDSVSTVTLMDPDIIDFLKQNCIVYRHHKGNSAPIEDHEKYGIGPSSFGSTMLLVDADGTVFGDTFTSEPITFYDFLVTSFSSHKNQASQPPGHLKDAVQIAKWHIHQAGFDAALDTLADNASLEAIFLRATIHRLQRDATAAIRELDKLIEQKSDAIWQTTARLEKTQIQLHAGHISAAEAVPNFKALLAESSAHPRAAEMHYWIALCQFAESDKPSATQTWRSLIQQYKESDRWAWQAAAALKSTGFRLNRVPDLAWPDEEIIHAFS